MLFSGRLFSMAKLLCNMANGIASHHPRTGLTIPAKPTSLDLRDWQAQELKDDHRVTVEGHDRGIPAGISPATVLRNRKTSRNTVRTSAKSDELAPNKQPDDKPRGRRSRSKRKDV